MNGELGLAGVGAGQVLGRAGVDARVVRAGVEDDQRVLGVVVHEGVAAALRQLHVVLREQTPSTEVESKNKYKYSVTVLQEIFQFCLSISFHDNFLLILPASVH